MSAMAGIVKRSTDLAVLRARAYAEANMQSTVTIARRSKPVFDQTTGRLAPGAPTTIYTGIARIYDVTGGTMMLLGEDPQYVRSSFVSIPMSAPVPQVDDVVEVTAHPDPALIGKFFKITDVSAGGQLPAARRLSVQGVEASPGVTP